MITFWATGCILRSNVTDTLTLHLRYTIAFAEKTMQYVERYYIMKTDVAKWQCYRDYIRNTPTLQEDTVSPFLGSTYESQVFITFLPSVLKDPYINFHHRLDKCSFLLFLKYIVILQNWEWSGKRKEERLRLRGTKDLKVFFFWLSVSHDIQHNKLSNLTRINTHVEKNWRIYCVLAAHSPKYQNILRCEIQVTKEYSKERNSNRLNSTGCSLSLGIDY